MSAIIHGIVAGTIYPQSDFNASQNEHGGWSGSQSFIIKKGGLDLPAIRNLFPAGKRATDLDPNCDAFYHFLRLISISNVSTVEGGYTKITAEFVGFYTSEYTVEDGEAVAVTFPTYSLRGTLSEEPFQNNPKWKALSRKERNSLGKLATGEWSYIEDPFSAGTYVLAVRTGEGSAGDDMYSVRPSGDQLASANAIEFAIRLSEGVSTYKLGSYEWIKRWEGEAGMTDAQLNSLSRIVEPPGNPPTPNGGRDWMMTGANQEQSGSDATGEAGFHYQNEISFLLSDRGGHDSFLQGE